LTEAELLSICLAPDHPTREHGLTVRRVQRLDDRSNSPSAMPSTSTTTKKTKRASSISILSGLGVRDPERALDPPSPTSAQLSPAIINAKRPSKLRNFFGQRPPSELITNHLTEYFPNAEKKVLERTARHSMMMRSGTISSKRHSTSSNQPLHSRFSTSTQGSGRRSFSPSRPSSSTLPPPVPEKVGSHELVEELPRMSLSTEEGRSVDLLEDVEKPQLLPPIPFPTESLSESMEGITGGIRQRPISRATSIASKRLSYMTELRSKRDRSDTASLMTVGEITAEVESRRASTSNERETDFDDWTKVDAEIDTMVPKAVESDEDDEEEESSVDEDETLHEEELSLDVDDHGCIRNIMSARRGAFVEFILSIMSDLDVISK
jgi:mitogen-activated protein kinase kinase kinase